MECSFGQALHGKALQPPYPFGVWKKCAKSYKGKTLLLLPRHLVSNMGLQSSDPRRGYPFLRTGRTLSESLHVVKKFCFYPNLPLVEAIKKAA